MPNTSHVSSIGRSSSMCCLINSTRPSLTVSSASILSAVQSFSSFRIWSRFFASAFLSLLHSSSMRLHLANKSSACCQTASLSPGGPGSLPAESGAAKDRAHVLALSNAGPRQSSASANSRSMSSCVISGGGSSSSFSSSSSGGVGSTKGSPNKFSKILGGRASSVVSSVLLPSSSSTNSAVLLPKAPQPSLPFCLSASSSASSSPGMG
mmetsp:Transcript_16264/g.42853  ORF Transcript_16264/g.42853 Transcript_16264/m.42853 type:complete len:209 (-) Transcript_16264:2996-3622(-)